MNILCVVLKTNFQIERFLSKEILNGNNIYILKNKSLEEKVKNAYMKRFGIEQVLVYDNNEELFTVTNDNTMIKDIIKELTIDKAYIPFTLKTKEIKFIPFSHMPDIKHFYQLAKFLRQSNIEKISFYDMGSLVEMVIPKLVDDFVDMHKGERAFVVGNGPSLNKIDMTLLKDELTFGSNRIHLGFKKWGFDFTYWSIIDRLQLEEHLYEWESKVPDQTMKFIPFEYMPIFNFKENYCPMNFLYGYPGHEDNPKFDNDPSNLYLGFTVTHTLLQLAVIMGCNPIYLIGTDHNYNAVDEKAKKIETKSLISKVLSKILNKEKKPQSTEDYLKKNIWKASDTKEQTHFDSSYNDPKAGRRFVMPRPEKSEKAFDNAKIWADEHGIQILNATPGTKLESFEKISYESLFGDNK